MDSWFIKVEHLREKLWKNTEQTYWVPEKVRDGRFKNWLANTRDWAVSRSRFWGTPIPIWTSDDGEELVVVSSVEELQRLTGTNEKVPNFVFFASCGGSQKFSHDMACSILKYDVKDSHASYQIPQLDSV